MKPKRICTVCGRYWNVSNKYPADHAYICPECAEKEAARLKALPRPKARMS